jgi:hypothetical protein
MGNNQLLDHVAGVALRTGGRRVSGFVIAGRDLV